MMVHRPCRATVRAAQYTSLLLALAACATTPAATTTTPVGDSGGFVVTLGNDTVTLERFTRVGNRIEGEFMQRAPVTVVSRYTYTLDEAGRPARFEFATRRPDGSLLPNGVRSITLTFSGDTIRREILRDTVVRQTVVAKDAFPFTANSFVLHETALRAFRARGADSGTIAFLGIGSPSPQMWPVKIVSPTAARVYYFGDPQRVTLDAQGRELSVDATATTNKVRVTRVPVLDVAGLAASFAAREQSGAGFAQTTRDTVRATVAGATFLIDYGRPVARGRQIFGAGGIVPPGVVWRTGANQATHFRTDREVEIGGTPVPAGTYTLWTLPKGDGSFELIINRQTGQWGTVYDAKQDLSRIPLRSETLTSPVERFTIAIAPQGREGLLSLSWDRTRLTTPIVVR
jgi:hypothetical protein